MYCINYYVIVQAENIQLPSFRGRRRRKASASGRPLSRRSCSIKKKNIRTIICIPQEHAKFVDVGNNMAISIPRGQARSQLFTLGLVGTLEVYSTWTEKEMQTEISDMFLECFTPIPGCTTLLFHYLASVPGLKLLQKPKVNATFSWDGVAVQSNSRGIVYILPDSRHILKAKTVEHNNSSLHSVVPKEVGYF